MHPNAAYPASLADVLRAHGFRATRTRIALLSLLKKAGTPLSVQDILARSTHAPDQATVYRMCIDLAEAGIVARADLNTGVACFEYTPDKPHHHHLVCTGCGTIEDIDTCPLPAPRVPKKFKNVHSHTLEFFGRCRSCAE